MTPTNVLFLTFLIGFLAGLRALTPIAAIAWGAHLGWLQLRTPLSWLSSIIAAVFFSVLAVGELVTDKLPKTPSRTAPPGFIARILMGALGGTCIAMAGGAGTAFGALMGIVGAVAGTLGGYHARKGLVKALGSPDFVVALIEDVITIGGSFLLVSRF